MEIRHLERDHLARVYNLDSQRLTPWDVLNAPYDGAWCVLRAGDASTPHGHHEYEIFIALSGQAFLVVDGLRYVFQGGDIAYLPPGCVHQVVNEGTERFEYYGIWWDAEMSKQFLVRHEEESS